jgi:uncharacterized protein
MSSSASTIDEIRDKILSDPDVVLDDQDVMRALIAANEAAMGENIVDLRGIAMSRLETRLDRLEDTHRSVIAAAYENLADTNQIHRAILRMLDPADFAAFLKDLDGEVSDILRVDIVRLVLESANDASKTPLTGLGEVLVTAKAGFVDEYIAAGRNAPARQIALRQIQPKDGRVYGSSHNWIRSEACMRLDFGQGRLPGMLVMGAEDPHQFKPAQGTDLLAFFAGVFERAMRRWLA